MMKGQWARTTLLELCFTEEGRGKVQSREVKGLQGVWGLPKRHFRFLGCTQPALRNPWIEESCCTHVSNFIERIPTFLPTAACTSLVLKSDPKLRAVVRLHPLSRQGLLGSVGFLSREGGWGGLAEERGGGGEPGLSLHEGSPHSPGAYFLLPSHCMLPGAKQDCV
eukprot:1140051-Pelagomonas_calceolata.AAC.1